MVQQLQDDLNELSLENEAKLQEKENMIASLKTTNSASLQLSIVR